MASKKPPVDDEAVAIAAGTEKQLGLPEGVLTALVAEDDVDFSPKELAKLRDVHGIDPKLTKRNAVESAGLLLLDNLAANGGDIPLALAEYRTGRDRAAWGEDTASFVTSVSSRRSASGMRMGDTVEAPVAPAGGRRSASGVSGPPAAPAPFAMGSAAPPMPAAASPLVPTGMEDASAQMSMGDPATGLPAAAVLGRATAPLTPMASPAPAAPPPVEAPAVPAAVVEAPTTGAVAVAVGPKTLAAYRDGTLSPERRARIERAVKAGTMSVPDGLPLDGRTAEKGVVDTVSELPGRIAEAVTGNARRTAETEAAPDWSGAPSWEKLGTGINLAALMASPKEALKILQANSPGMKIREDEKGNQFFTDPVDDVEYAVKPGFRASDIVRTAGQMLAFVPAGRAVGVAGMVGTSALTQGVIETAQVANGGEFNPEDIALAGAVAPIGTAAAAVGRKVAPVARGLANAALDAVPGSTTRVAGQAAASAVDDVTRTSVPRATPPLSQAADAPAVAAVADAAPAVKTPNEAIKSVLNDAGDVDFGKLATLSREATREGAKGAAAKRTLAQAIDINPEAVDSAARLGIDLPADVLGDSVQLQRSIGQLRAQAGSEAEKRFVASMDAAVRKADDVVAEIGGAPSAGDISSRVLANLDAARADLKAQASKLYEDVDVIVKKPAPVTLDNLEKLLIERKAELGGVLKGPEADLERLVGRAKVMPNIPTREGVQRATYGALAEEKALVGRALSRLESMYGSMDERVLKRLYGAMAEDQLANVKRIGGEAAADKVRLANKFTSSQKALEEKIVGAFGKEGQGSIASLMEGAIKDAGKGNVKRLNQLLDVVPEEMRGEVLTTALSALSRAKGGAAKQSNGFGFAEFSDVYRGLRSPGNEGVYKAFAEGVGVKRAEVFRDLFEISKRVTSARASIPTTGKANQPLLQAIAAENLVGKIVNSALGANVARAAGAGVGAAAGGPIAAMAGAATAEGFMRAIAKGGLEEVERVGALLSSEAFKDLAVEVATQAAVTPAAVRKVVVSQAFRDFASSINLPRDISAREKFLTDALTVSAQAARIADLPEATQ